MGFFEWRGRRRLQLIQNILQRQRGMRISMHNACKHNIGPGKY